MQRLPSATRLPRTAGRAVAVSRSQPARIAHLRTHHTLCRAADADSSANAVGSSAIAGSSASSASQATDSNPLHRLRVTTDLATRAQLMRELDSTWCVFRMTSGLLFASVDPDCRFQQLAQVDGLTALDTV